MTQKVFVIVQNDEIRCYHNLKQLTDNSNLPYFPIFRALAKNNIYKREGILIGFDIIKYKRKPKKTSNNAF